MANGTRTAPTVSGTPSYIHVSFAMIDSDALVRTDSYNVPTAAGTNANIEAYAVALQAISGASLYEIEVGATYKGDDDASNAQAQEKDSIADNLVISTRVPATPNSTLAGYVPAPDPDLFVSGTDVIDPTNTDLAAYFTAVLAMFGTAGRVIQSATFSQRRKSGTRVRI